MGGECGGGAGTGPGGGGRKALGKAAATAEGRQCGLVIGFSDSSRYRRVLDPCRPPQPNPTPPALHPSNPPRAGRNT